MADSLDSMSRDRLENIIRNAKEKAERFEGHAVRLGLFAGGAMGTGFYRAKWGMPQYGGQDASVWIGGALAIAGLLFPNVRYADMGMYLGAGMLSEKLNEMGRKWGEPKQKAGGLVGSHDAQPRLLSAGGRVDAEEGLRHIIEARREAGY